MKIIGIIGRRLNKFTVHTKQSSKKERRGGDKKREGERREGKKGERRGEEKIINKNLLFF